MIAHCPHCDALTPNVPSLVVRYIAVAAAWAMIIVMLIGLSLASLFAVPLVPVIVFAGAALVGSAHQYAFGERICEECGKAYELDHERAKPALVGTEPASALAASPY
jgi:hypothetical protein